MATDRKVRLVAVDSQFYGSRQLRPGDSFEATEGDAADVVALGIAKLDATLVKPAPIAKKRKYNKTGKYKRRDMRAQDA